MKVVLKVSSMLLNHIGNTIFRLQLAVWRWRKEKVCVKFSKNKFFQIEICANNKKYLSLFIKCHSKVYSRRTFIPSVQVIYVETVWCLTSGLIEQLILYKGMSRVLGTSHFYLINLVICETSSTSSVKLAPKAMRWKTSWLSYCTNAWLDGYQITLLIRILI